jgi:N-acetylneuraminic acid mutarotase
MKTKNKISAYILRGSMVALLFSCVIVALCSAINLPEQPHKALPPEDNTAFSPNAHESRSLSFADRVAYQRAIEDVYWRHRIWPDTNRGPKPLLDAVMSQAQLERKVEDYLRNSQALGDYWQRPITADQLQAEMERMASHTKQSEVLREIFEALGNDPFVIAECLARPVLAERLAAGTTVVAEPALSASRTGVSPSSTKLFAADTAASTENRFRATNRGVTSYTLPEIAGPSGGCIDDTWVATTLTNAPPARGGHTAVWSGSEMIVWGATDDRSGGRYNPSTDSWTATSTTNAPVARSSHTAVWTGSEMIVWGGDTGAARLNTGGRYNPITDSWTATGTANAPTGRFFHTAVWAGSEMIVWGGFDGTAANTGGRYDPSTDSWTPTSTTSAPVGRIYHKAVWTGSEMIVWGGYDGINYLNSGGRYNPGTNTWTATSPTNAPDARSGHTAVWADSEMIVWAGFGNGHLNTGGRYNPITDSWTATGTTNAPAARDSHTAVWTDSEMIVWGGQSFGGIFNTGGRYHPSTDSWTATSLTNAPTERGRHTAVWTGSEMIVWGATDDRTGGRYCAAAPSPTPTPTPSPTPAATATATPSASVRPSPTARPRPTPAPRP